MKMKKIVSFVLCFVLTVSVLAFMPCYASADDNGIISLMSELEIMQGDPDGNLRLDETVSRAEFTKMVLNASEYKNSVAKNQATSTFKDVLYSHWASPYIRVAVNKGIVTGYSDSTFRPDNCVLYEEALNICLKLLGYTSEDFGTSWPYGQIGLSENIGLLENVNLSAGDYLTRRDAMNIIYNMLNTYIKGTKEYYASKINYTLYDDVTLIASANEDVSVGSDKVYTSSGTFKVSKTFNYSDIGKKGTLVVKNNDEAVGFMPSEQVSSTHSLYKILDGEIIVSDNGQLTSLDVGADLSVYYKSLKYTLSDIDDIVNPGDIITVYKNKNGIYDYATVSSDGLTGPYIVNSAEWFSNIGIQEDSIILRNGTKTDKDSIELYDVLYYSKQLKTVWAYSKKVTGIYESASPNIDNPSSVTISGVSYKIEGTSAYVSLSSSGGCNIGDTVTVLIGRDGSSIAGVMGEKSQSSSTVYGYLIETGTKEYTSSDKNTYNSYYVKIVDANENVLTYPVSSDYEQYKNSVVGITLKSSGSTLFTNKPNYDISGEINADKMTVGSEKIATGASILDVTDSDTYGASAYKKVYIQNMDNIQISRGDVLYVNRNTNGEISEMILKNVTGDAYSYGIVTYADNDAKSYSVDVSGETKSIKSSVKYNVYTGNAVRILADGGNISSMKSLSQLNSGISDITYTYLQSQGKVYPLAENVCVYKQKGEYMSMSLSDLLENKSDYIIKAYYDKPVSGGGKIRVIVAQQK